jgi:hypothetical protein
MHTELKAIINLVNVHTSTCMMQHSLAWPSPWLALQWFSLGPCTVYNSAHKLSYSFEFHQSCQIKHNLSTPCHVANRRRTHRGTPTRFLPFNLSDNYHSYQLLKSNLNSWKGSNLKARRHSDIEIILWWRYPSWEGYSRRAILASHNCV